MLIAKQKKAKEKARKEEEKAQKARLAEEAKERETSNRRLTQSLTFPTKTRHV